MRTVYCIFEEGFNHSYLVSVWSSQEAAVAEMIKHGWDQLPRFEIDEIELDVSGHPE